MRQAAPVSIGSIATPLSLIACRNAGFTNVIFGLGILAFLLRLFLLEIPWVGAAMSSIVGVYWLFMVPHLAGLLFRRHNETMEKLYWATGGLGY